MSNFYVCWFLISNLVKAWLLEEYTPFIAYLICGCNIQTRSAHVWKWVTHRQFRHGNTQIPAAKPRCIAAACFAPLLGPQQNALFTPPTRYTGASLGWAAQEDVRGNSWQLLDTRKEGICRTTLLFCSSPKTSPPTAGTLQAERGLRGQPSPPVVWSHTTNPSWGFLLQPKGSQLSGCNSSTSSLITHN